MNKVVESKAYDNAEVEQLGREARAASKILAKPPTDQKNKTLRAYR